MRVALIPKSLRQVIQQQFLMGWTQFMALARDIVLCSWARHFTLTVPLSTQVCNWVPANLMLGGTLPWTSIPTRGSTNTPSRFMLQKPR